MSLPKTGEGSRGRIYNWTYVSAALFVVVTPPEKKERSRLAEG